MRVHTPIRSRDPRGGWRAAALMLVSFGVSAQVGCLTGRDGATLASLHDREPDLQEAEIGDGLRQAMAGYRAFLEEAPQSALTPEAMRRLADLKLEKEYGPERGASAALPRPDAPARAVADPTPPPAAPAFDADAVESDRAFEARATAALSPAGEPPLATSGIDLPGGAVSDTAGPTEAIALYDRILATYPDYAHTDQVLYQKARAFDELGRTDEAIAVAGDLVARFPDSRHVDELQFRRGEYFFTRKRFLDAEDAYGAIAARGAGSDYYELALYKLGWTLYKQMMLEEALEQYVRLLDHKVDDGYDFDQTEDENDQQRIADTYRVISLCFSELGGAESITAFFAAHGPRVYEHRVYRQLGEFYLEKLRYADAATTYRRFVELHPFHAESPRFGMRVIEIYAAGQFPKLVLEAKKDYAASYGLAADYWSHFDVETRPEVVAFLKSNLEDLANHYHALYQNPDRPEDKPAHFRESASWYQAYLGDFPAEPETPAIHYRYADLQLENADFGPAAREYERIAYDYPPHDRAADAGYAAIFAHREHEQAVPDEARDDVRRDAVASTLRFVEAHPDHEHAAKVLGAAVDDLYALGEHARAIEQGHRLIDTHPDAAPEILRAAWLTVAHAGFDTAAYADAEAAYDRVLALTPAEDERRTAVVDNLAAAIYKQGEAARAAGDPRAAAEQFLRISTRAPESGIRPMAEYDAGAALVAAEAWREAGAVFAQFRERFPTHELAREATRQIAHVYRSDGLPGEAAEEYERVAEEAEEPALRRESLLEAARLYREAERAADAVLVLRTYLTGFPEPLESAVAARFELAELYAILGDGPARVAELERIIDLDRRAGPERTDVVRVLAARSALVLAETAFEAFATLRLTLPFEQSLDRKKRSMARLLDTLGRLVDYQVGEVTAAATFYMAEVYDDFSVSLLESERPDDLGEDELIEYELVLEEEAYPFEEKSIEVHEKNLELMASGVFNRWIEKSIGELAVVMPGRYAKFESSTGLLTSPRTYTYRRPTPEPEETPAVEPDPMVAGQEAPRDAES